MDKCTTTTITVVGKAIGNATPIDVGVSRTVVNETSSSKVGEPGDVEESGGVDEQGESGELGELGEMGEIGEVGEVGQPENLKIRSDPPNASLVPSGTEVHCPVCFTELAHKVHAYAALAGAEFGLLFGEIGPAFWLASVHRVSGAIYAFGVTAVLHCWLGYRPDLTNVALVVVGSMAMLLLNSVDPAAIVGNPRRDIRQKATILIGACYVAMFVQISGAAWTGRDGCIECCSSYETFYGFCVILAATCMRFVGVAFGDLWGDQRGVAQPTVCCAGSGVASVATAIVGSMCFVLGLSLQVTATIGKYGSPAAMAVPLAYVAPVPILLIVRAKLMARGSTNASSVWLAWSRFFPAAIYIVALAWPASLGANGHLTPTQTHLCYGATVGIVLGARLGVHALEVVSTSAGRYSSLAFELQ